MPKPLQIASSVVMDGIVFRRKMLANVDSDRPHFLESLYSVHPRSGPKWTTVRSKSTAIKCLIGACHYLSILTSVKPASHHKVALGLTLLRILSKVDKPINAGIHVRNVGTQFSGITVL